MSETYFECPNGSLNSEKCNWISISGSVRDAPAVGVRQCGDCGLVTHNSNLHELVNYADGTMHNWAGGYGELSENPEGDPQRRLEALLKLRSQYKLGELLDFGSGDGSMLKSLSAHFSVTGLEPEINAREKSTQSGFTIYSSIDEIINKVVKFDVITMFHVIEHIYNPSEILNMLKSILRSRGILILETPNSNDALLRLYENKEFENWTYWSHHPMLYSHESLSQIVTKTGYEVLENDGVQRYSIANHLYWLSKKKPGGHEIWNYLFSRETSENYNSDLIRRGLNDTLWLIARLN